MTSEPIQIPGLPGLYVRCPHDYAHAVDANRCPACGGLGVPWHGWFTCDNGRCRAVALVETGVCFVPLPANPAAAWSR